MLACYIVKTITRDDGQVAYSGKYQKQQVGLDKWEIATVKVDKKYANDSRI